MALGVRSCARETEECLQTLLGCFMSCFSKIGEARFWNATAVNVDRRSKCAKNNLGIQTCNLMTEDSQHLCCGGDDTAC